jgi:hypothetical protein
MTTLSQGLPNVIVYLVPKFREARLLHLDAPFSKFVAHTVSPVLPSVEPRDENLLLIALKRKDRKANVDEE